VKSKNQQFDFHETADKRRRKMERTGGRQTYPGSKGKTAAQQKRVNESAPGSIIYSKVLANNRVWLG